MSKPEKKHDERTKAEVTTDVTAITANHSDRINTTTVHDKEVGKARLITIVLSNGRTISVDAVDDWQDKLEKCISKFKNK